MALTLPLRSPLRPALPSAPLGPLSPPPPSPRSPLRSPRPALPSAPLAPLSPPPPSPRSPLRPPRPALPSAPLAPLSPPPPSPRSPLRPPRPALPSAPLAPLSPPPPSARSPLGPLSPPPPSEALHREQMLEQKLATLQCLLATTQEASESSWQALIDEDRLLSRLEVMGNQLQSYSKNQTEDGMRNELVTLQEDKFNYEITAKESLRRVLQEKIEVARKLSEVERSLSNTEDECSHLKEMKERNHEELRELANKYNGAVNEIKNLTDKIKLAEGRQEELTQRGQMEKKELQLCIDELEEREQTLQARFEALQADNDFSNERLTALQVGLEQLQEKSIKDNNSLAVKQLKEAMGSSLHKLANFDEVIDAHLQNSQTAAGERLDNPDRLKENHLVAKDSEMSDTLSPSKDRSSDDTSDGNMDDHELNEPQNRVALLKDELRMANLEPRDREQVIHHLHKELLETQELANTGKQKCLELQALLEEERRSNKQQTEESAKQIQYLQSQLGKLAVDMEELKEQRESSVSSTQEELYSAQEEVLVLHHAMEAATAERERDISALQRDLGGVTAELEKWRQAASKYEQEINSLQATFQQQSLHQQSTNDLQGHLQHQLTLEGQEDHPSHALHHSHALSSLPRPATPCPPCHALSSLPRPAPQPRPVLHATPCTTATHCPPCFNHSDEGKYCSGGSDLNPPCTGSGGSDLNPPCTGSGGSDLNPPCTGSGGSDLNPPCTGSGGSDLNPPPNMSSVTATVFS
ncbi:sarcolemmal membrane-associated protein-like [Salvelinus namaycush]|uniref:Sarcolemmal membrane-associated protein-like n=1 Tax=Salvelinus namaycush TaxID=8040 RepID=A0A8U0P7T5_SALNM|nr:sarcolemmal membrane-associated protein-like [Salvelinus namaycush]